MSNLVFYILSEYDQLTNSKRKVTFSLVLKEIKKEKLLFILLGVYFLLLISMLFVVWSNLPYEGITMTCIAILMVIVLGVANVISDKKDLKNEKDNYDKYKKKQNEFAKILKNKYNIKTLKQLENIIEYCDHNSKQLKLTNRISNGFKIVINKITIPLTTFLGGIALTKYEIALEYILVIWITMVMVTFAALGVIYTIKIASEEMFDIKSRKFESLSNILRDIRITHYIDKIADDV